MSKALTLVAGEMGIKGDSRNIYRLIDSLDGYGVEISGMKSLKIFSLYSGIFCDVIIIKTWENERENIQADFFFISRAECCFTILLKLLSMENR